MTSSFVVAIAGGSASGKSTLASDLLERLPANESEVIPMDRYMRRDDPTAPTFFFRFQGAETMDFNHPESADNAAVLRAIDASPARFIVVEGLMPLAIPAIRDRANLRVFIELDADIRAIRRMLRDIRTGRGGGDPEFIAAYFLECARVGHARYVEPSRAFADVVVRGDANPARTAALLVKLVEKR